MQEITALSAYPPELGNLHPALFALSGIQGQGHPRFGEQDRGRRTG